MILRTCLISAAVCIAAIGPGESNALSREIHVSKTGSDSGSGSQARPYLTINKAASVAQPGDVVTVHGGTYREWVKPPRGGTDERNRITYRAAPGEIVFIKGSERITSWTHQEDGVWKAELPELILRRLQSLRPEGLGGLAELRQVASSWGRLSQWRGVLREGDGRRGRCRQSRAGIARWTTT